MQESLPEAFFAHIDTTQEANVSLSATEASSLTAFATYFLNFVNVLNFTGIGHIFPSKFNISAISEFLETKFHQRNSKINPFKFYIYSIWMRQCSCLFRTRLGKIDRDQ